VIGTTTTSAGGASRGTLVTSTADCATGKVILGGGAQVITTDTNLGRAVLVSSYPSSTTTWTAIGVVTDANLGNGKTISATAYALCSE
jgi:hypothetical protein